MCWRSKLQQVVTRSTTEAEYIAAGAAGMQILLGAESIKRTWIHLICTSKIIHGQSVSYVCGEEHGRMKHLDLCYYWLRDQVAIKKIQPLYLKTKDMPADLLTKPLAKPQVEKLQAEIGLVI